MQQHFNTFEDKAGGREEGEGLVAGLVAWVLQFAVCCVWSWVCVFFAVFVVCCL